MFVIERITDKKNNSGILWGEHMKQLKKVLVLLITAILLVTVCACGKSPASDQGTETKTVTDSLNRQVEVPVKVDRIVTLSNVPRMAVYLGLTDKIVGYSGMEPEKVQPLTAYAYAVKDELADVPIVGTDAGGKYRLLSGSHH